MADPTPLAQRLRDIAGALIHEASIMADSTLHSGARLEAMAADLSAGADQLADHVAQTRQAYDLFAALLLVEYQWRGVPLNSVSLITERNLDEVKELQVEINRDLVGNFILSLVERGSSDG